MTSAGEGLKTLGIARLVFGCLVLLRTTPLLGGLHLPYLDPVPLLGWPSGWHIAAFGLALPDAVVIALCIVRTAAVVLFAAGAWTTLAGVTASVLGYVVLAQNVMGYVNTLHLLWLGTLVLAVSDAGARLAIRPEPPVDAPSGLLLVRALVVSVYAWSGLAKLNPSWLRGDALVQLHGMGIVHGAVADALLATRWGPVAGACVVAATELALGPLLVWRRTRAFALVVALSLHASLELSIHPDFFGFAMSALLLSFVGPKSPRANGNPPATRPLAQATR